MIGEAALDSNITAGVTAPSCTTFPKDCKTPSSLPKLSAREIGLRLGRDQGRPKFFLTGTTAAVLFSGKAVGRAAAM